MIRKIKELYIEYKLKRKKRYWKKTGDIVLSESVIIFPETSINATRGHVSVGNKSCIRGILEIQRNGGQITIGENCYIGDHTRIWAAESIKIGNNVLIAHNVNIFDNDTHPINYLERREDADGIIWHGIRKDFSTLRYSAIEIDDDAWIGAGSFIMKGVKIGRGTIVAACSVVTKDVPSGVVVGGNPARVLKHLNTEEA